MKSIFSSWALPFVAAAALCAARPACAAGADGGDPQRLVTILDYISTDYAGAVAHGAVTSALEYDEQKGFIATAMQLARDVSGGADDPLSVRVTGIGARIDALAEAGEVARLCREARDEVVARFDLATAPAERPSLPAASTLFAEACAACHGKTGDGNTALAATLDPRPANFRDPERLAVLSPYRVFNTLTFGVPGTGMASYDALTPAERWSLAFYVFRLAHAGERAQGAAGVRLSDLARATDADLQQRLATELPGAEVAPAVAFLRSEAPFIEPPAAAGIAMARKHLGLAATAYAAGRKGDAERALVDAYLQGFEPLEPKLMAKDPRIVPRIETEFGGLRRALAASVSPNSFARQVESLDAQLEAADSGRVRAMAPFLSAFLIVFREGIEAALLVAALLAGARRLGRADAARMIHVGWLLALPAGVVTWWAFERLLHLGAERRELMEALVALAAAAVLFSVSFWMISKAESRHWLAYLRRNLEATLSRRNLWLVAGLAFLAAYREVAETVLFLQAILLEAGGAAGRTWAGAAAGLGLAFVCAWLMNRAIGRLPLGAFFGVSGVLLCLLAISFAGAGMYTLVASGYVKARPVPFPEVPWMGIHPDLTSLLLQFAIAATIAAGAWLTFARRPAAAASAVKPARPSRQRQ